MEKMQAKEIYDLAVKCYNGDESARREWFSLLAPLAQEGARKYGVLPGIVLARSARESGWGSDLYEKTMEKMFGVKFDQKAQKHNNMVGMVSYGKNDEYLPGFVVPMWGDYRATFEDYGPHGDMSGKYTINLESWKEYYSIEDCFEDFCAVIRSQAYRRGEEWPSDLRGQLLSMGRGYTPEGGKSTHGMDFSWQDTTLDMYDKYNLYQYDNIEKGGKYMQKLTTSLFDAHIKRAYEFAHTHCKYGRTDTHYPPGETGYIDCVGLIFRAFYTLGRFPHMMNIDQLKDLCLQNGFKMSKDINDVFKHHGVACFQDLNNRGTEHINHVYYSLGGSSLQNIDKYDLGSNERIRASQPFTSVPVDEWVDKDFLFFFYLEDEKKYPSPVDFENLTYIDGIITETVGMYEGPGTEYKKIRKLKKDELVIYGLRVTNPRGQDWRQVKTAKGERGWIYYRPVKRRGVFDCFNASVKKDLKDGFASLRIGAGAEFPEIEKLPCGSSILVDGDAKAKDNSKWFHIVFSSSEFKKKKRGYIYHNLIEEKK